MKNQKIFLILTLFIGIVTWVTWAESEENQISYLDHKKKMNAIICEKMVICKQNLTATECLTTMNQMAEANQNNATIFIENAASQKCVDSLKEATCENVMGMSIIGPCSLKELGYSS